MEISTIQYNQTCILCHVKTSFCFVRLTKEWPRFKDELDTVKFMCTDFWTSIYKKPIDNLRTNHQGVYVLQDNAFRFMNKISVGSQYLDVAPMVSWKFAITLDYLFTTFFLSSNNIPFSSWRNPFFGSKTVIMLIIPL